MKKTAMRTAKPSPRNGNRLPLGNHPGNTGGKPGRSGRRPSEVTAMCQRLVHDHNLLETVVLAIAQDPNASRSERIAATRLLLEYGEGKPVMRQELSGPEGERFAVGLHIFDGDHASD